jgi:hypothetical protein
MVPCSALRRGAKRGILAGMKQEQAMLTTIRRLRNGPLRFLGPLWRLARYCWRGFVQARLHARRFWLRRFAVPGYASQIHLSWSKSPSSSFTVAWWTPASDTGAYLIYRRQGDEQWQKSLATSRASPGVYGYIHHALAEELQPDYAYEYCVSNDAGCVPPVSPEFTTRTAPAGLDTSYTAAFVCDTGIQGRLDGNADGTLQVIEEVAAHDPLFVIGAGDYAYAKADKRFDAVGDAIDAWFKQMQSLLTCCPMMAQYGNHELYLEERYEDWAPRFHHPAGFGDGRDYCFEIGPVFFLALCVPNPPYPLEGQLAWMDGQLAAARQRGLPWLVVFQHEPVFAHGHSHPAVESIREAVMPVLHKHRVDLHLSGHDQSYERTFPVILSATDYRPSTQELYQYSQGEGVIYAKISPGGKRSNIGNMFSRLQHPLPDVIAVYDDTAHHYALLKASRNQLTLQTYALKPGQPGRLLDELSISC